MKIYNEIVIDMNPESSTFEKTMYEDSFEYEGELALCDWKIEPEFYGADGKKYKRRWDHEGNQAYRNQLWQYDEQTGNWDMIWDEATNLPSDDARRMFDGQVLTRTGSAKQFDENPLPEQSAGETERYDQDDWGAEDLSSNDFLDEDGNQRPITDVYNILDKKLTGITGDKLWNVIKDIMPKYSGVSEEEIQQAKDDRDLDLKKAADIKKLSLKEAEVAKEGDVYQIQKAAMDVSKLGTRESIGAQMDLKKGFDASMTSHEMAKESALLGYDAAKERAEFDYDVDIYDLEKGALAGYMGQVEDIVVGEDWFVEAGKDPKTMALYDETSALITGGDYVFGDDTTQGAMGGYVHKDGSGIGRNRKTKRKTFTDFLTQLPDAGGN